MKGERVIKKRFEIRCPDCFQSRTVNYSNYRRFVKGTLKRCRKCSYKYNAGIFKQGHSAGLRFGSGQKEYRGKYTKERAEKSAVKLRGILAGDKHWNWKGGITTENRKIRRSREYLQWREAVFSRDDYTCVLCGKRGIELNADHIKPFCDNPDCRLSIDNGRTLCVACHRLHGWSIFRERNPKLRKGALLA